MQVRPLSSCAMWQPGTLRVDPTLGAHLVLAESCPVSPKLQHPTSPFAALGQTYVSAKNPSSLGSSVLLPCCGPVLTLRILQAFSQSPLQVLMLGVLQAAHHPTLGVRCLLLPISAASGPPAETIYMCNLHAHPSCLTCPFHSSDSGFAHAAGYLQSYPPFRTHRTYHHCLDTKVIGPCLLLPVAGNHPLGPP